MLSEMAIMTTGRPTNRENEEWCKCRGIIYQIWQKIVINTPWYDVVHVHLSVDVVNLYNKQVEINSFNQHPTESCHQKILHKSCCCDTSSLQKRKKEHDPGCKKSEVLNNNFFHDMQLTMFSVAFIPARNIICPAPRDTERLKRICDRGSRTSLTK